VSPEQQKQKTLHALLTILLHIATQQPLLFVMEDLHWIDPSTLELLSLLVALGAALQMAKGLAAPEVERAYTQAYAWCQQVGETPALVPVLLGLWRFYLARSQLHTTRELGDTLLRLAQRAEDRALAVLAHYALGVTSFWLGALPAARMHLTEGIARDTPDQRRTPAFRLGADPGVACRSYAAATLWSLRYPEQALARLRQGMAAQRATGAAVFAPYLCTVLADVSARLGHPDDGLQALAEAHTLVEQQEARYWEAEVCRLRGVVLLRQPGTPAEAEAWVQRALDVASRRSRSSCGPR
jgi:predicted ATPase